MCLCCVVDGTGLLGARNKIFNHVFVVFLLELVCFGAGHGILRCICVVLMMELFCLGREMGF